MNTKKTDFKKGNKVRLIPEILIKAGYLKTEHWRRAFSGILEIEHIFPKAVNGHYYKKRLLDKKIYTVEELSNNKVYKLAGHFEGRDYAIAVIDDDIIKVEGV
jgi:hypothetical protein